MYTNSKVLLYLRPNYYGNLGLDSNFNPLFRKLVHELYTI